MFKMISAWESIIDRKRIDGELFCRDLDEEKCLNDKQCRICLCGKKADVYATFSQEMKKIYEKMIKENIQDEN